MSVLVSGTVWEGGVVDRDGHTPWNQGSTIPHHSGSKQGLEFYVLLWVSWTSTVSKFSAELLTGHH